MGLDFSLQEMKMTDVFSVNYTHNVVPMWSKAGAYEALYKSQGKKASEIIPILSEAINNMIHNKQDYEKLNPKNGWGDYDGALRILFEIRTACECNPEATIDISA